MRLTPRVAGFRSEYPAGFKLECMAGFVGTRILSQRGDVSLELPGQITEVILVRRLNAVLPNKS
jgi:hypothetical protein